MTRGAAKDRRSRLLVHALALFLGCAGIYVLASYVVAPTLWHVHERRHPALDKVPRRAVTSQGIPGDLINLSLIAGEDEVQRLLLRAGWWPADPTTFQSVLRIAADTVARRPYETAPISNLYVWGRHQDLAFEQPAGEDPRSRHHVRLWRPDEMDSDGRPLWAGAATFDTRSGVSHFTWQVTHHIAPDVDRERDKLLADLQRSGEVDLSFIAGFQRELRGRNGGGDPYFTDGRLAVASWRRRAPDAGR